MSKYQTCYDVMKFPASKSFRVFKVFEDIIWQIMNPEAYNIDTGEVEYLEMDFIDPVTAGIIVEYLNEAEVELNG